MIQGVDQKELDRLFKMIHAKEVGTFGTEAEAQAWAAHINRLLLKNRLTEAQVKGYFAEKDEMGHQTMDPEEWGLPKNKTRRVEWMEDLAQVVAESNLCKISIYTGSNMIGFWGRQGDREVAVFMYVTLARSALKMVDKIYRLKKSVSDIANLDMRNFKASFLIGFTSGIRKRLSQTRHEMNDENPGFALMVRDALVESQKHLDGYTGGRKAKSIGISDVNLFALMAGKRYAEEVEIGTGVGGRKPPAQIGDGEDA
jgi:hypothetical protein